MRNTNAGWASLVATLACTGVALAGAPQLGRSELISPAGTWPSVWQGTVAYLEGAGGAVMFYDGVESVLVYPLALHNYEPDNRGGVLAWRNSQGSAGSNEILRWDGGPAVNISNSPGVVDTDVAVAENGDVLWVRDHYWLMWFDASVGEAFNLNTPAIAPAPYVTPAGTLTYAYQDPVTFEVKYFDGTTTLTLGLGLGQGTDYKARPSVHGGAVAWIGRGAGDIFVAGELYYWKDGLTVRVTNDDALGGRSDDYPSLWYDLVVWQRAPNGGTQTRLYLWDGTATVALTTTRSLYPSLHGGTVAWVDYTSGLRRAPLISDFPGDCSLDGQVDAEDLALFVDCCTGPGNGPAAMGCGCSDLNADDDVDFADFAGLQRLPGLRADAPHPPEE